MPLPEVKMIWTKLTAKKLCNEMYQEHSSNKNQSIDHVVDQVDHLSVDKIEF